MVQETRKRIHSSYVQEGSSSTPFNILPNEIRGFDNSDLPDGVHLEESRLPETPEPISGVVDYLTDKKTIDIKPTVFIFTGENHPARGHAFSVQTTSWLRTKGVEFKYSVISGTNTTKLVMLPLA